MKQHLRILAQLLIALVFSASISSAQAQDAVQTETRVPAPSSAVPSDAVDENVTQADAPLESISSLRDEVAALRAELADMRVREIAREEEALAAQLIAEASSEPAAEVEDEPLRFYGFMDMGMSHLFIPDKSLIAASRYSKATSFFLGNINLYADANPHPDWRGLFEVRFTNYPHGNETSLGVVDSTQKFERQSTSIVDHTNPGGPQVILGSTVIERAFIQWQHYDAFRLQVGYWLTPFGIWNVDHGQPTLISLLLPQFIAQRALVVQQLGLQALGKFFVGDWSFDYAAYVSNGRIPGQLDLTEDKALGGRIVARTGRANILALGSSIYYGTYDETERTVTSIDVIDLDPFTTKDRTRIAFDELSIGGDISYDRDRFRFRVEGLARRVRQEEGKEKPIFNEAGLPAKEPSSWHAQGYVLGAYELPFWGLEPYAYFEFAHSRNAFSDYILIPSGGFNVHFNARALLKAQYIHSFFRDTTTKGRDEKRNDGGYGAVRLVLSF